MAYPLPGFGVVVFSASIRMSFLIECLKPGFTQALDPLVLVQ